MVDKYTYTVGWSAEDEAFVARVAEFRSLAAHGDTSEEALSELKSVVDVVVCELQEEGKPVPQPFGEHSYSGKLNIRMMPSLHRALAIEAAREGISLNQLINTKLADFTSSHS